MTYNDGRDIDNATARKIKSMSDLLWALIDNIKLTNYDLKPNDYITRQDTTIVKYDNETKEVAPYNISVYDNEAGWKEFEEQVEICQYMKYFEGNLVITPITTEDEMKDYLLYKGYTDIDEEFAKWGKLIGTDKFILVRLKQDLSFKEVYSSKLDNIMQSIRGVSK